MTSLARTPTMVGRWNLAGGAAGLLAGGIAVVAARVIPIRMPLDTVPGLQLVGVAYAALVGGYSARRVTRGDVATAIGMVFVLGIGVAALTAVTVMPIPPFVLVALASTPLALPLTLPAAGIWAALLWWSPSRRFLDRPIGAGAVVLVVAAMLVWRFQASVVAGV